MDHTVTVTIGKSCDFDYAGDEVMVVKWKHRLRWTCNKGAAIVFLGASPFDTGEHIVQVPTGGSSSYLTIRQPVRNRLEIIKYNVIAFDGTKTCVHDPHVIIDDDGGGGGDRRLRTRSRKGTKQRRSKKGAAKK